MQVVAPTLAAEGAQLTGSKVQRNPHKLRGVAATLGLELVDRDRGGVSHARRLRRLHIGIVLEELPMHPHTRTNYPQQSPALYRKFAEFGMAVQGDPALDAGIAHLVDLRASQLNGCVFCVDMHVKEAKIHGERELRLHHVAVWRESPLFDDRERAALAWTEALTTMAADAVPDELYAEVAAQFAPDALVALTWRVVAINGWNRVNVAFRAAPGSLDAAFGLERAGLR